jgi:tetratricopeptide (TPR) repeat protein
MLMRSAGIGPAGSLVARGLIDERAPVLVADFSSPDSLLARAATEAFRVDLSQSPVVKVVEPSSVTEALARMGLSSDTPLDADRARELARREGIPAVVVGDVTPAGRGFVLTARLVEPADGSALASQRETASDTAAVLGALDKLSKSLRERIGESYVSLRADPALEKVTTPSLDALQRYTEALRAIEVQGDPDRAVTLLEEAVELDPGFAMAWRKLGIELRNQFATPSRIEHALTKAYENRERLTERERHFAAAAYYSSVTGEEEKALAEYERLIDRDPNDAWALNNAAIIYADLRDMERADRYLERAFAVDSGSYTAYTNLAYSKLYLGEDREAETILDRAHGRFPGNPSVVNWDINLATVFGDFDRADSIARGLQEDFRGNLGVQKTAASFEAMLAAARGRLDAADRHLADVRRLADEADEPEDALQAAFWAAWNRLEAEGDTAGARRIVDEAAAARPLESLPFVDRPYLQWAVFYALSGQPERARELVEVFESGADENLMRSRHEDLLRARAAIALGSGDPEQAVRLFRESDTGSCTICAKPGIALAWDRAGQADSALAAYEAYLSDRQPNRLFWDGSLLGSSLERAARLADEIGDVDAAAGYYARFVELWKNADAELQPRVDAARSRLQAILRERG